ncbi:MAG: hypothetical protein SFV21_21485 [Rhodospirillaceae bacterium]|nr:hypothetical protein [Rhodospirillaceae bacterium]
MIRVLRISCLVAALAVPAVGVLAFGTASPSTGASAEFKAGEKAVKAGAFDQAIEIFTALTAADATNADAFNYLAFSQRNLGQDDAAMANYAKALAIDPAHKGALAYQGELFLKRGDLAGAQANLARLDYACGRRCAERDSLQAAIERVKDGKAAWSAPAG